MTVLTQSDAAWLKSHPWPPVDAKWLRHESIKHYRQSYRDYRQGKAKGAKGELLDIGDDAGRRGSRASISPITEKEIEDVSIFEGVGGEDDKQHISKMIAEIGKYRLAYRQFRSGSSRGAEGELSCIASGLSKDHFRLLPVAQLAACLASKVKDVMGLPVPKPRFHCHVGCGKLAMGLVIPAIVRSKVPFAVIQRPTDEWEYVMADTIPKIAVYINGQPAFDLHVIRSLEDLQKRGIVVQNTNAFFQHTNSAGVPGGGEHPDYRIEIPEVAAQEHPEEYRFVVLAPELDAIIMRSADALSCSLGPAIIPAMSQASHLLPPNSGLNRPALYACENDHKAVDVVREVMDAPLYVRECMVDRICSDRVVKGDKIYLTAEPYEGEIVVTDRFLEARPPAFSGSNIHMPRTRGEYSYLYMRKFLLVNGTHTTLAFMTLRRFCKDASEAPGDFTLLRPEDLTDDEKQEVRCWAAARVLLLLHNHAIEVIKSAHGVESDSDVIEQLWKYAARTIERFGTVIDTTKRVLGGGVTNRYQTRLRDVLTTIETFDKSFPFAGAVLEKIGMTSMEELKDVLRKLVRDARKFVIDDTQYQYKPHTQ